MQSKTHLCFLVRQPQALSVSYTACQLWWKWDKYSSEQGSSLTGTVVEYHGGKYRNRSAIMLQRAPTSACLPPAVGSVYSKQDFLLAAGTQKCQHPVTWKLPSLLCHSNALQWQLTSPGLLLGCSFVLVAICKWEKVKCHMKKWQKMCKRPQVDNN